VLAPSVAALLVRRASPGANAITGREVLFVSEATVKSHLSHICSPLGVDTRAGAVAAAIERRILRA
jgi:ATP/maltotriose-dependent transcriptional regulator MalT